VTDRAGASGRAANGKPRTSTAAGRPS